jgi:outer membrane protein TolC
MGSCFPRKAGLAVIALCFCLASPGGLDAQNPPRSGEGPFGLSGDGASKAAVPAEQGGARSITLDEAVNLAAAASLGLQKQGVDLSLADYAADRLWAEIFPSFSLTTGLSYGSPLFTGGGPRADEAGGAYSFSLGISLSLNGGIPQEMKRIALAYRMELLNYESARRQLETGVARNFYALLAEEEQLRLLRELLLLAERQLERNRIGRANGLVSELTELRSSLGVETARYNLYAAQTVQEAALREFLDLLGVEEEAGPFRLEGDGGIAPVELDGEALINEYLPRRPDILSRRQAIELRELEKKRNTLAAKAPSLNLSAQWRGGSPSGGGLGGDFTDNLSGSLSLAIPIDPWIPGTRAGRALRGDEGELEKARLDLRDAERSAKSQIRSLAAGLRNSWESAEVARLRLRIAERAYELTEEGFMNGTVESLVLEEARNDLAEARRGLLREELAFRTMILDLAAALNADWKTLMRGPS